MTSISIRLLEHVWNVIFKRLSRLLRVSVVLYSSLGREFLADFAVPPLK